MGASKALEAQLYLKKKLVSSARKLRDFKEVISSLRRENEFLKLSESRAKMAKQENATCVEELALVSSTADDAQGEQDEACQEQQNDQH
ncbi:hypothetical protein ACOSP7_014252 [Xanthoceras sorbifolium]